MNKPGPKPKHPIIKKLEGNPGHRPIPDDYLDPDGEPQRPDQLMGYAREVWEIITANMPPGVFSAIDAGALVAYCQACKQHRTATEYLELEGYVLQQRSEVVVTEDGTTVTRYYKPARNPWATVLNEAAQKIATLGPQLGLTPTSRASIKAPAGGSKPKASKFEGLVSIKGGKAG